jgi:hypothetical protein
MLDKVHELISSVFPRLLENEATSMYILINLSQLHNNSCHKDLVMKIYFRPEKYAEIHPPVKTFALYSLSLFFYT